MSDFLPPDAVPLDAAAAALAQHFVLRDHGARETQRTFYDTFDGLVHGAGMSVVHETATSTTDQAGRLSLVDQASGAECAGMPAPRPADPLLALALDPGPLRDALLPIVEVRALLALVEVRTRVRALDVLDDERKTVVRMRLEQPALVSSGGRRAAPGGRRASSAGPTASRSPALRSRLRLVAVRGYDKDLARMQDTLQRELGFTLADQLLVDEAVRADGGVPGGISSKINVPLSSQERADVATAAVLRRLLEVMLANVEGAIADTDSEFLHDFRVSVRRSRAVQRECKRVFPPAELARFRDEFRWLQAITGDVRDLDVYVAEFDDYRAMVSQTMRGELDPLLGLLRKRRSLARRQMVRSLRSDRANTLYAEWSSFLEGLPEAPTEERPDATRPIAEVSGERISRVYKRMVKMGTAIDASSPAEDYHELRKQGKELRYLLELFGAPLHPAEVVKPMIKALKALQDVLGLHQDREVQVATLRSLRDEVSARPGGAGALMAMGVLVEHLGEDERAARDEFGQRFSAFASAAQRRLVKDTFG